MLQVKDICKQYKTGNLVQQALDHVSLSFRDSEFVAILGPSGSGKTTLLNVIGGLDRYDSGDLVINGVSTSRYTDRDWDTYRNHTVGFIFQSYNLIPLQCRTYADGIRRAARRATAPRCGSAGKGGPWQTYEQAPKPAFRRADAARGHCTRTGERPRYPFGR